MLKTFRMSISNKVENIVIIAGAGLLIYFLFRKKINNAITPLKDDNVSLITPLPDVIHNAVDDYIERDDISVGAKIAALTPTPTKLPISNIIDAARMIIPRIGSSSNKSSVTTKQPSTPSYKDGTLTFSGQGYSVAPQNVAKLTTQLAQRVYVKRDINPYD